MSTQKFNLKHPNRTFLAINITFKQEHNDTSQIIYLNNKDFCGQTKEILKNIFRDVDDFEMDKMSDNDDLFGKI